MRCKNCKEEFKPEMFNQKFCSKEECHDVAIKTILKRVRDVKRKKLTKDKRETKERLKTNADHVREFQIIFNKYVRLRDKSKRCISCNRMLIGKYDAGHYYSTGGYPELRFNEDNVHGQCVYCNQHRRGNLIEYLKGLKLRIGIKNIDILRKLANTPRKYTIDELKDLKVVFKKKIKELN